MEKVVYEMVDNEILSQNRKKKFLYDHRNWPPKIGQN